jgi:hypothetical protein
MGTVHIASWLSSLEPMPALIHVVPLICGGFCGEVDFGDSRIVGLPERALWTEF